MVTWNSSRQSAVVQSVNKLQVQNNSTPDEIETTSLANDQLVNQPSQELDQSQEISQSSTRFLSGTWQPQLLTPAGEIGINVKHSSYTVSGNLVTVFFDLSVKDFNQLPSSCPLTIANLPFVSEHSQGIVGGGLVYYFSHTRANISLITCTVSGQQTSANLWRSINQAPLNRLTVADLQNIANLAGQIQYTTLVN